MSTIESHLPEVCQDELMRDSDINVALSTMAHPSTSTTRNLSLTEELEKLEQSITLTLQEIDHNFSRAHRIVTTSILPIVERYAEHSTAVWEGSKFWKQFFEASANVSLSGYEELATDEDVEDTALSQSHGNASTYATSTSHTGDDTVHADGEEHETYDQADDSLLDSADISGSTPRPAHRKGSTNGKPKFADYPSPYEALKRELKGGTMEAEGDFNGIEIPPTTPGPDQRLPDMSMTPTSSPFAPMSHLSYAERRGADPLLHRVLDKNYRLQATPHSTRRDAKLPAAKPSWRDTTSPMSSPPSAAPQLRSEIFNSPVRQQYSRPNAPRTPGVSVQTPAKSKVKEIGNRPAKKDEIDWESDSDQDADDVYKELGMSPPKTIQFAIPPSRLLQTPAREASKQIVEDLLMTAGAGQGDTDAEESPSMIKVKDDLDDSF